MPGPKPLVRAAAAVLCAALLGACATAPAPLASQEPDATSERTVEAPRNEETRGEKRHADRRPQLFHFDKMSVSLSEGEKANVAALAEQARSADSILIRGYCDRTEVGNAKDAAIARAQAVRKVLLKAGVPARSMRVRYNTERKMHAAEVELQ
ncbi:MAG: OmpA family protein [Aromatoleum sp.]|uniref:OmpA family protein n=1 Tax=Aromatoleum sp. TaxID=2307007 RepID=UPI002894D387|nr:OmpA family protein [Aromatoleum sp.]MDT3669929.1 OmpA family protein [Aromatoleum sp.]